MKPDSSPGRTLLCAGVTASELEFWLIPAQEVAALIDDGVFANQHGGAKSVSNTFWFVTDDKSRSRLTEYRAEATGLRDLALSLTKRLIRPRSR
jgi:hypothetical protein